MKTNCKVCAECGATFTAYTTRAKYCSSSCSRAAAARKKCIKAAEKRHENLQAAINAAKKRSIKNGNLKNNSEEG